MLGNCDESGTTPSLAASQADNCPNASPKGIVPSHAGRSGTNAAVCGASAANVGPSTASATRAASSGAHETGGPPGSSHTSSSHFSYSPVTRGTDHGDS